MANGKNEKAAKPLFTPTEITIQEERDAVYIQMLAVAREAEASSPKIGEGLAMVAVMSMFHVEQMARALAKLQPEMLDAVLALRDGANRLAEAAIGEDGLRKAQEGVEKAVDILYANQAAMLANQQAAPDGASGG